QSALFLQLELPEMGAGQPLRFNWFFAVFCGIKMIGVSMRSKIHSSILKGLNSFSPGLARFPEGLPWVIAIIFYNPEWVESKIITT
ncbi:MAG TPA: hypothetical protein VNX46_12695, partial [Candidatus Acidoferrum sp.]|nr:hypothetical protein [Candidatus Acidoferrum sp.]